MSVTGVCALLTPPWSPLDPSHAAPLLVSVWAENFPNPVAVKVNIDIRVRVMDRLVEAVTL